MGSALQPMLFGDYPPEPELVRKVKEFIHTGKIALKDDERCEQIVSAVLEGASKRATARRFRCARETVDAIVQEFELAGKLRPLKERLAAKLMQAADLATDKSIEMMEEDRVPANVLPIMLGVMTDKAQLLTGLATAIVEQKGDEGAALVAWLERVRREKERVRSATVIDVQSSEVKEKGQ